MAPGRGRIASGLGLVASITALAAGGLALGIELERRIVSKRIVRNSVEDLEEFFSLRSDGPDVLPRRTASYCIPRWTRAPQRM